MPRVLETSVLIVGAGPVGLTLAMDLARRGVDVLSCETRARGEPPSVKCNHVSARSMEIFRTLGVADKVRAGGLPPDYPHDCVYRTAVTGQEITRITIPSRNERRTALTAPDTWWPTAEPPHRINQIFLEPILFDHAVSMPGVRILSRTEVRGFMQDDKGIRAQAVDLDTGEEFTVAAQFMIGCDGGRSAVRREIGAKLVGNPVVQRVQSTYIRAPKLLSLIPGRPGWMNLSLNPRRSGNTIAIDGRETWLIHNYLYEHETDFDAIDRDASIRTILGVDSNFQYEVISNEDWIGRRLVADKFRDRRVFICGDSAHIWVPYAGYGMNAGIADATNLSWLLAAYLSGWASSGVLEAYERERLPITEQVSHFAMNHALGAIRHRRDVPQDIEKPGADGERIRAEFGREVYELNVQQYCCGGLNFGYFYADSPIIAHDGEQAPGYTMADFTPSTVPGCRTPFFSMKNGQPLYDAIGQGYTLLRFDPAADAEPFIKASARKNMPVKIVDVEAANVPGAYTTKLVLSRTDCHVAWRGDALPSDPSSLVERLRGAA